MHQTTQREGFQTRHLKQAIRLIASDIDGTLLNPQFQISPEDLAALRRAHDSGIEIVLVIGRRHTFALPIAKQLGFDFWLIARTARLRGLFRARLSTVI